MNTDICRCGNARVLHPEPAKGLKAFTALMLLDKVNVCIYGRFELDRKATWKAERGNAPKHFVTLLTGCTICKTTSATYHKGPQGQYLHTGCPGAPKAEAKP